MKYDCVTNYADFTKPTWVWSVDNGLCPANPALVRAMLKARPNLVNESYEGSPFLAMAIANCCGDGTNWSGKAGCLTRKHTEYETAKLMIEEFNADVNVVVNDERYIKGPKTILDSLRIHVKNYPDCTYGHSECDNIEQLLLQHGAKTYAELQGETTSASVAAATPATKNVETKTTQNPVQTTSAPTQDIGGCTLEFQNGKRLEHISYCSSIIDPDFTDPNSCITVSGELIESGVPSLKTLTKVNGKTFQESYSLNNVASIRFECTKVAGQHIFVNACDLDFHGKNTLGQSADGSSELYDECIPYENAQLDAEVPMSPEEEAEVNAAAQAAIDDMENSESATEPQETDPDDVTQNTNLNAIQVRDCRPCAHLESVNCEISVDDGKCVYKTTCKNGEHVIIKNGEYDARCEQMPTIEPAQIGSIMCSNEELDAIGAAVGFKDAAGGKCEDGIICIKEDFVFIDGKCVDADELQKNIDTAEQNYADAKARETSLENRALSGATMAVTGLGAMQLAQGLAEQSADRDADAAMTAYLEHLKCKIGDIGREYSLSNETEVATPGDELSSQRSAYAELAYSIKTRKEQLGLRPGIESEIEIKLNDVGTPYIERTDGLYNDVGSGAGGTYASLYRAKMGNEADQAKIDADKGTSKARVVGGGVAAGVGAVGGAVGNILINGDSAGGDDASLADKAASLFLGKSDNKSWKYLKVASIDVDKHCKLDGASVVNGIVSGDIMANCGDELKSNGCPENIEYFEKSGICTGELASNAKKCKLCKELSQKSADCVQELDSYCKTQGVDRAKLLKQKMGI